MFGHLNENQMWLWPVRPARFKELHLSCGLRTPVLSLSPGGQLGRTLPGSLVGSPEPQGWAGGARRVQASCQAPFPRETFKDPCPPRSHADVCRAFISSHVLPMRRRTRTELMPQHLAGHPLPKTHPQTAQPPHLSPMASAETRPPASCCDPELERPCQALLPEERSPGGLSLLQHQRGQRRSPHRDIPRVWHVFCF